MKKGLIALAAFALLLCVFLPAMAEDTEYNDRWTVMIYMCGSDLESRYGYGTGNLEEIMNVKKPQNLLRDTVNRDRDRTGINFEHTDRVNVLVGTGGAKEWHAQSLGMEIRSDVLQYWRYDAKEEETGSFVQEAERPLASMADPDTLSDFIRWGTETHPAEKYALVLWSHGGGSATGIFIDELFGGEYMTLDLLEQALDDGGTHFEAVVFDACMMANIETACAIQEHANWMIASEELVAGKGSAMDEWLQELYYVPAVDGRLLGRWICDTAMIKYADNGDEQAQKLLTWSVIDLGKIKRLEENFDLFFRYMSYFYKNYPSILTYFATSVYFSEEYGTGHENMFDLSGIMYEPMLRNSANVDMQTEMQVSLAEAVDYCVRGTGRPAARGISFCYATDFSNEKLDVYSHNCPSPHYLALLDAISPWEAPEWIYDQVELLPEQTSISDYQIEVEKAVWKNGSPAFYVTRGESNVSMVQYELYREDVHSGQTVRVGSVPSYFDPDAEIYRVYDLTQWPSIDGGLCQIELQNLVMNGHYNMLYNIPVMIDSEVKNMRCGYWFENHEYRVLGIWDGYDSDSSQFNRNVQSLAQVAGRDFNLIYEVKDAEPGSKAAYVVGPTMIMYRSIELKEITLPAGTYYLQFNVFDAFMRPMKLGMVELSLNGNEVVILDTWEGTELLDASDYYSEIQP